MKVSNKYLEHLQYFEDLRIIRKRLNLGGRLICCMFALHFAELTAQKHEIRQINESLTAIRSHLIGEISEKEMESIKRRLRPIINELGLTHNPWQQIYYCVYSAAECAGFLTPVNENGIFAGDLYTAKASSCAIRAAQECSYGDFDDDGAPGIFIEDMTTERMQECHDLLDYLFLIKGCTS